MVRKYDLNHKPPFDAETLEYLRIRTRRNLVWQLLDELKGLMDGSIITLRDVKSVSTGQRRALRSEGIIRYASSGRSNGCRHIVTELGKLLIAQESNA